MSLLTQATLPNFVRSWGTTAALVACGLFVAAPTVATAQEKLPQESGNAAAGNVTEPVIVAKLGSLNQLMQDVNYIATAIDQAQLGGMFSMMAATFTQGIDPAKPIGVLVPLVNGMPQPVVMLPTSDIKGVLKRLEAQTGPADELDDGTLVIAVGANTIYMKQQGDWAVGAGAREHLGAAPADPTSMLDELGDGYLFAAMVKPQIVSEDVRTMLIEQINQGFEQAMQAQAEATEQAREVAENSLEQLETMINDTESMKLGVKVDQTAKQIVMDMTFIGEEGSSLADLYNGQKAIPSQFASVIRDDAIAYVHSATSIGPKAIDQAKGTMKSMLKAADDMIAEQDIGYEVQTEVSAYLERIGELVVDSISEGRADFGAAVVETDSGVGFVGGAFVSDGGEVEEIFKEIADKVEYVDGAPTFKFNTEKYEGVDLHVVNADIPADMEEARQVFGDSLEVHLGTGEKAVYVAIGNEAPELMKKLIEQGANDTPGDRPIGQANVQLLPILEFVQGLDENDTISTMVDALSRSTDPGIVNVVANNIENGQEIQVTLSEGTLKAMIGALMASQDLGF